MTVKVRPFLYPVVTDNRCILPAVVGATGGPPGRTQNIIQGMSPDGEGGWSGCDFWVNVDPTWVDVTFELLAADGESATILERKRIADIESPRVGSDGSLSGILFGARDRSATRYEVRAYFSAVAHPVAHFRLTSWRTASASGDQSSRLSVDPFAHPHQQVSFPTGAPPPAPILPGITVLFGPSPTGSAINVTRFSWSTDDVTARDLTLRTRNPVSAIITARANYRLGGARATIIVENLTYPIHSDRGDVWEVDLSGPAIPVGREQSCNCTGYEVG